MNDKELVECQQRYLRLRELRKRIPNSKIAKAQLNLELAEAAAGIDPLMSRDAIAKQIEIESASSNGARVRCLLDAIRAADAVYALEKGLPE